MIQKAMCKACGFAHEFETGLDVSYPGLLEGTRIYGVVCQNSGRYMLLTFPIVKEDPYVASHIQSGVRGVSPSGDLLQSEPNAVPPGDRSGPVGDVVGNLVPPVPDGGVRIGKTGPRRKQRGLGVIHAAFVAGSFVGVPFFILSIFFQVALNQFDRTNVAIATGLSLGLWLMTSIVRFLGELMDGDLW